MATIDERCNAKGEKRYRVRLRMKPYRVFNITFDSYEEASQWVEENEENFKKNPKEYFDMKKKMYFSLLKIRKNKKDGILKPFPTRVMFGIEPISD